MRTEAGTITIPMAESESLRSLSYRHNGDCHITSPTSCPRVKSPFQKTLPSPVELSTARHQSDSYQLKITGKSSSISTAGSAKLTLEKAVMLALVVERFKKKLEQPCREGWSCESACFEDSDLLGNFNALVEEAITYTSCEDAEVVPSSYRFMKSECQQVRDEQDKSLKLSENLQLLAMFLQQPKDEVTLNVRYYKANASEINYMPVVLGINDQNLFLSCTGPQDNPRMEVEKWDQNLHNISSATDLLRFVFFKKVSSAGHYFEFESAKYRGWYISTSRRNKQPVEMDVKEHHKRITIFTAK
ncbi:interleukin-1 beta isoform X1 [Pristis pectinata]|uniref:interleukin-1 beta isoform X1 n=1 Tax=Pristis pectinata TaxID=685728 RepID=UPI00223D874B|nr:interleukin-1 beta isoform X1 [Pristis pectinata]